LGLDVGRYFWRVSAVNDKGMEGSLSEFARFSISRASSAVAPPTLTIDAWDLRANVLQIKGRIEPGASLFINGQHMDIQADGTFNEFITFEKLGQQEVTVRAVGINGGTKELTRSVVIAY
jgi:hypothetical protein